MSLTKNLLSRTENHTIMPNCGAPGCTNRSTTNPEKLFHGLPSVSKKEWGIRGWRKLIENCIQKNHLSVQTTLNLNI